MVAGCPKCSARYRVDAEQIGPDGAKLRCTKCSAVFLVRAPRVPSEPSPPVTPESESEPEPEVDAEVSIIVADSDEARGKAMIEAIEGWGLTPLLVHDGVEAMLAVQRKLPTVIILDAGLPKMSGFQVCEIVKRNESLRETKVMLVGALEHQDGEGREASESYGADVDIESPDLPAGLLPLLRDAGLSVRGADVSASESPIAPPAAEPTSEPRAEAAPMDVAAPALSSAPAAMVDPENPERTAERERAQRLARIAVSEMVLYQPEKFDQAAQDGTLEQTLDLEIQEARALLRQRIGEEVRAETDFIIDELNRVAEERAGNG